MNTEKQYYYVYINGAQIMHKFWSMFTFQLKFYFQRERHDRKVKTPAVVEPPQELWTRSVTHAGGDIMNTANKEKLVTKVLFGDEIDNSLGQKEHPELSTNTNSRKSNSCSADACDLTAPGSSVPMAIVAPLTSRPSDSSVALTMSSPPRQLRAVPLKRKLFQVNWDSRRRKKDDDTGEL